MKASVVFRLVCCALLAGLFSSAPLALERKDVTFKIFQFPANQIPRIDGKADDWAGCLRAMRSAWTSSWTPSRGTG